MALVQKTKEILLIVLLCQSKEVPPDNSFVNIFCLTHASIWAGTSMAMISIKKVKNQRIVVTELTPG